MSKALKTPKYNSDIQKRDEVKYLDKFAPNRKKQYINSKTSLLARYKSGKALERDIISFFENCEQQAIIPTKNNLCVYLNTNPRFFVSSKVSTIYKKYINRAFALILAILEQRLITSNQPASGLTFYLKNAFNWTDKTDSGQLSNGSLIVQTLNYHTNQLTPLIYEQPEAKISTQ